MKMKSLSLLPAIIAFPLLVQAGQEGPVRNVNPPMPVEQMVQKVAAAETANKVAREQNYTFTQDYDLKTLGIGGFISGEFHRVSDIVYDDHGNRLEQITFFPQTTITDIQVTNEDINDAAGVQPFALTTEALPKYNVTYLGKQREDELDTYVFDVKPKRFEKGQRYFDGRIWVDDHDMQIVKTQGIAVPPGDQAFPHFTSYRENIDGKYWFPTYVYGDDVLQFKKSPSVHVQMTIRYTKYKKFSGTIRVVDAGGGEDDASPPAKPAAKPPQKPPLDL